MKKPRVSLIILNYNGIKDTRECLKSVFKTRGFLDFEIFLVDNGSLTNEAKILAKEFKNKKIRYFRFKKNLGFAGANNKILKKSKAEYALLLNNDTRVEPNWLSELMKIAELDKRIAACQAKIRSLRKPEYFEYAGAAGGFIDQLGYPYARGRIGFYLEKDKGQYDQVRDIFWGSGTCLLLRREVLKKSGLLPEEFFFYHEETDLCWRLKNLGYRIVFVPKAIVYHQGAAASSKNLMKRIFFVHRNNLLLITRNMSLRKLAWVLPLRLGLEIAAGLYYLATKRGEFIISVVAAGLSFTGMLPKIILYRLKNIPFQDLGEKELFPLSIFWLYFVKKTRRFSQIENKKEKGKKPSVVYLILNLKETTGTKVVFEHIKKFTEKGCKVRVYTLFSFWKSYFQEKPDVLTATFWPTAYLAFLMRAKSKFYFAQDWEEDFYSNRLLRFLARSTYLLPLPKIALSRYLQKRIERFDRSGFPVYKINYAVLEKDCFKPRKEKTKKQGNTRKILSVISWYNQHKGPDLLVKAVKKLKKKHPEYIFILVSREKKAIEPIFDEFVSNPSRDKLAELYGEADVLLVTSRTEGFFIPGLEAMACGCPVLTTNCGGVLDYVKDQENALILKRFSDLWQKEAIERLLTNKPLLRKIVKNGYKTAAKYDNKKIADDFEKIYFCQ